LLFTKSTVYTLQALVELSKFDKPVDVTFLSKEADVPKSFLAKLLQHLTKGGIVASFKGVNGGFKLAKKPEEIKIVDIFKIVEDKDSFVFYCTSSEVDCKKEHSCGVKNFFVYLEKEVINILNNYTLEDVIRMNSVK
jgi:Rrf2 family protein